MRLSDIVIPVLILLVVMIALFTIDHFLTNRKSKP